jgi:hypothetical protein
LKGGAKAVDIQAIDKQFSVRSSTYAAQRDECRKGEQRKAKQEAIRKRTAVPLSKKGKEEGCSRDPGLFRYSVLCHLNLLLFLRFALLLPPLATKEVSDATRKLDLPTFAYREKRFCICSCEGSGPARYIDELGAVTLSRFDDLTRREEAKSREVLRVRDEGFEVRGDGTAAMAEYEVFEGRDGLYSGNEGSFEGIAAEVEGLEGGEG